MKLCSVDVRFTFDSGALLIPQVVLCVAALCR